MPCRKTDQNLPITGLEAWTGDLLGLRLAGGSKMVWRISLYLHPGSPWTPPQPLCYELAFPAQIPSRPSITLQELHWKIKQKNLTRGNHHLSKLGRSTEEFSEHTCLKSKNHTSLSVIWNLRTAKHQAIMQHTAFLVLRHSLCAESQKTKCIWQRFVLATSCIYFAWFAPWKSR